MMSQPSRFWDKIAERYAKQPVADRDSYERKLRVTRDYLGPDMSVLEFGCGTGSTALSHAPYANHIRAIDISSKIIEIARGKAESSNVPNVAFERSPIEELTVPDRTFDAVLGLSILHLLENKEDAIAKVFKCSNRAACSSPARHASAIRWRSSSLSARSESSSV